MKPNKDSYNDSKWGAYLLIAVCWYLASPLLLLINRDEKYMKKSLMWILIIFSSFTVSVITLIVLVVFGGAAMGGMYLEYLYHLNPTVTNGHAFAELFSIPENPTLLALEVVCLPVYAFCVGVLYMIMIPTGWSYRTASVYVCEYGAPWFCALLALVFIYLILTRMRRLSATGKWLMCLPLAVEVYMVYFSVHTYLTRKALYAGMSIDSIFGYVVDYLYALGESTHTNYVIANIYVYILPPTIILLAGLAGWLVKRFTRIKPNDGDTGCIVKA